MNYLYQIYMNKDELDNLNTPHCVNVFLVIEGQIQLNKYYEENSYGKGDVFVIFDYEDNYIIKRNGILACISINNQSYNRFSLANRKNLFKNENADTLVIKTYIETLKAVMEKDYFNSDIGVIKLINCAASILTTEQKEIKNNSQSSELIKNIVQFINENYKRPLSLSSLAQLFYVNRSYLSREFSRKMNMTLMKYIKKVKIYNVSRELLENRSPDTTWREYGYASYKTFLNDFKNIMGTTPSEFLVNQKYRQYTVNHNDSKIYDIIDAYYQEIIS
ncbi:helix-turn-helix transcriptional regulator [Staphylococcus durrellii]|uniref:helix-turn-helix transcriptional regulator n=1 Tax=Staphylococcus durrellii TaxID=2781773 RepID=UPI00189CD3B4|nr:AraC family transcriptional regulator [Staphylococcus durrellii]MBF7016797.1 helix-turn-helix transcriptional regulator [Staphylococcus durrellii]